MQRIFQVRAIGETFDANDFDWGEPDEIGDQYFSFFENGSLIRRIHINYVLDIADVTYMRQRTSKSPQARKTFDLEQEYQKFLTNWEYSEKLSKKHFAIRKELQAVIDTARYTRAQTHHLNERINGLLLLVSEILMY